MNNEEIKEIFCKLRSNDCYEKEYQKSVYYEKDLKKLEDCITNLQEDVRTGKEIIGELEEDIKGYEQERENLFKTTHDLQKEIKRLENKLSQSIKWNERRTMEWLDYKSRCEKAIEYMKLIEMDKTDKYIPIRDYNEYKKLLNILNGGKNND